LPDFVVLTNKENRIIEVKGELNNELVLIKAKYAKLFYGDGYNYMIYRRDDLVRMGVMNRKHDAMSFCMKYINKIRNLNKGNRKYD